MSEQTTTARRPRRLVVRVYALALVVGLGWAAYGVIAYSVRTAFLTVSLEASPDPGQIGVVETSRVCTVRTAEVGTECLSCHGADGTAKQVKMVKHPEDALRRMKIRPLTCATCHFSHEEAGEGEKFMLRKRVVEETCEACHGDEAEGKFRGIHR